ncbi:MAG: aspartate:alanine exchanger family transporter [Bacteroidia bacterium]|nr:aspartate:alanine exchanger family transporter [Bacteroidia bacterium]
MIDILNNNPILLLFLVASLGYLVGSIKIRGGALGVAGVLFTGLVFGGIDARLQIPEIILQLGLSLFVYSIGLSSGPAFFHSYKKNGFQDILFIASMLVLSGLFAAGLWFLFGFSAASIGGIYSGSTTNTAALAGLLDMIAQAYPADESSKIAQDVVVGYSFSYPMGVLGGMIAIVVMEKLLGIDYEKEKQLLRKDYPLDEGLTTSILEITNPEITGISLRDLFRKYNWHVVFGRTYHNGEIKLVNYDTILFPGDLITILGNPEEISIVEKVVGRISDTKVFGDTTVFDARRIIVSNPYVAGRTIASLNIHEKYNLIITRIRRGDIEMLAKSHTVLELGDSVRITARKQDLDELAKLFGDSYLESSKINLFSFGLGIGLGLILGNIEFSFGGDISFKLGFAGGPLVVGLFLGALRRTGPIVWALPYSANITLHQIGLILLLASIGVRSGNAFVQSFSIEGLWIFLASATISLLTAFSILFIGYKIAKKPFTLLMGMVANQPAILDFATNKARNRIPEYGFSMMFPIALISKIVIAQILFLLLR